MPASVPPSALPVRRPRQLPSREVEPPFDPPGGDGPAVIRGSLALAVPQPVHPPGPDLRLVRDDHDGPRGGTTSASVAAAVVVRALAEVLSGTRPARQLAGWTTDRLQLSLERRQPPTRRAPACSVRSVRVCEPRPGVAEVAAVIRRGDRVGALALRMEMIGDRWRLTALQVG